MNIKKGTAKKGGRINTTIRVRIFIVIIATAVAIIASGLAVGGWFFTRGISTAIEDDMLVVVDIADKYVTAEIEMLKIKAAEAAGDIRRHIESGGSGRILERVLAEYPMYIGLAVFDDTVLLDSWGEVPASPDLFGEPFMRAAMAGGQAVSTTMRAAGGSLVMYVSAPINGRLVLAAALPGLYLNGLVSQFTFWRSGHLFIDDADGYVIANIREEWVKQRINFIEMAETDSAYEGISSMVTRGISGERGAARFSIGGVPRICAFRPVSGSNEGWFLGIVAPPSESVLKDIPGGMLLIGIISMILSLTAATLAAAILKRPYEEADRLRREAEVMSLSKSAFLANMSHEIRTPMNSIMGFSELALDHAISPKTRDYLGKIRMNAEWLLQIINDILDISKIESGKMELENIPFDMHELFVSCRTLIMPKAVEKGIKLHFYAEPSVNKKPLGDPTRLRQVFVNLLSNAVKFTNTGMIKLLAEVKNTSRNTVTIYFEVKDSGIGMTSEQIKKVFDPFTQAETGTTRKYGGTGLGLAITRNIVEMMGGTLSVESVPGVGCKFSFEVTFDTIDVSSNEESDKKIVLNKIEKPFFEGEILLCEDNAMNQQIICEHLAKVGLKTVVAENGKIGVETVQDRMEKGGKQFDLIFMDMHMPVMDGLEAAAKILELDAGIPIVAMTANVMSDDREIYKASGMNDCVGKPFTSQELWRCLLKYFTPLNRQGESAAQGAQNENELRHKLIAYFVKDNRTKFSEIAEALNADDIKLAHRLAHTLKGNAGQLGKILLQQAAANVENQLKDGNNLVTPQQMKILETELNAVIAEFAPLLDELQSEPQPEAPPQAEPFDAKSERELIEKLEPMLEMGNPECRGLIDSVRLIPGSEVLIRQMEDLDFEPAIVTLAELKKKMIK